MPPGLTELVVRDTACPALQLQFRQSGPRYIYRGRVAGRENPRTFTIGDATLPLASARSETDRLRSLARQGTDANQQRTEAIASALAAETQSITFAVACGRYLAEYTAGSLYRQRRPPTVKSIANETENLTRACRILGKVRMNLLETNHARNLADASAELAASGNSLSRYTRKKSFGGMLDPHRVKAALDGPAGVADWTWHDLRRTMPTLCADEIPGFDLSACDLLLMHTPGGVAAIYQGSDRMMALRRASEQWASEQWDGLLRSIIGREPANIRRIA